MSYEIADRLSNSPLERVDIPLRGRGAEPGEAGWVSKSQCASRTGCVKNYLEEELEGGFSVDVVTMGYKGLPKYEEVNKNFRIHRVKCLRSKKELCHPWEQLTYLFFGYFKCKALLKKNKFDICHCHFIIPTGVLAQKLKKKFGLEYIITAHESDVLKMCPAII